MVVSQTSGTEIAFPRGGQKKKPSEPKINNKTFKEKDLFSASNTNSKSLQAQKNQKKKQKAKEKINKTKDEKKSFNIVESLSYGQLTEGMLVMGKVSMIRELDMRISLPGRLMATCPITNISSAYTNALKEVTSGNKIDTDSDDYPRQLSSMFKLGQVVICSIMDITKTEDSFYNVTVSLDPTKVQGSILSKQVLIRWKKNGYMPILIGSVKSIEDHGYVIDTGILGTRAFLPKKKAVKYTEQYLSGDKISIGQLISCKVAELSDEGLDIKLTCEPSKLSNTTLKVKDDSEVSVHNLLPGTSIYCVKAETACKGGIQVDLGNELNGFIHRDHLDRVNDNIHDEQNFKACVLYIIPTLNRIHLTAKKRFEICSKPMNPFKDYKIGDLVKDAEVIETSRRGLVIKLPETSEKSDLTVYGFVPVRHMSGAKEVEKNLHLKFPVGTRKTCRIFQYDYADDVFLCSFQKSVIEQSVLKIDNLKPGDFITGKVKRVENRGIFLDIGKDLSDAFIPALHMSDVPLKHPEKKFLIGDKLKCRVLRVEPEKKKLFLTAKNILVNEEYPIISVYDQQNVGKITEGVVVSVSTEGLLLQLFGETKGWVPKKLISSEGPIEYPEKLFFIGQALKCQVVNVDPENRRMTLSLIIGGTSKPIGHKAKKVGKKLKLCTFYQCKVSEVATDGLALDVETQAGNDSETIKAFLPKDHLTDHPCMADLLLSTYNKGDLIERALCFERDVVPIMSIKPLILTDVEENENSFEKGRSFEELNDGLVLPGVVCLVKQYGVFLRLATRNFRKSALIPTRLLADAFIENPEELVKNKQTLFGKIVERDDNDQKITMSGKLKDVHFNNQSSDPGLNLIESLFNDMQRVQNHSPIGCFVGSVVTCTVTNTSEFGVETEIKTDGAEKEILRGLIPKSSCIGLKEPMIGDVMCAVVVYVEHQFRCVELSPQTDLINKVTLKKDKGYAIKEGQTVKASVVLRRSELGFVTLCIKSPNHLSGHFVHVPTKHHINDMLGFADLYTIGETYSIIIKKKLVYNNENVTLIGMLEKHSKRNSANPDKDLNRKRTRMDSISSQVSEASDIGVESKKTDQPNIKVNPIKKKKMNRDINFSILQDLNVKVLNDAKQKDQEIKEEAMDTTKSSMEKNSHKANKLQPNSNSLSAPGWDNNYNPWAGVVEVKEEKMSDDEEESQSTDKTSTLKTKKHLSKKEKKELDRLEASEIARLEKQVLEGEKAEPVTAAEFDRLVLTSPDSSLCWIKYMAFYISKKDYDQARAIAKKALTKINFREEGERLNIYMAWFNLENSFGSQEDADNCFKEALKCNDEFEVYSQVGKVYDKIPDKAEKAEWVYKTMARKFCKEPEPWLLLGKHYFSRKDKNLKEARFTLQRALQNLEKRHHVSTSAKFGQFEFQYGEPERGKQIFENIISNFPKRTDQWNVYIDLVIKNKENEFARDLFERMIGLNLKPAKMKFMFKKYMEFEQSMTSDDQQIRINNVRRKATEYLESLGIKLENEEEIMEQMEDDID